MKLKHAIWIFVVMVLATACFKRMRPPMYQIKIKPHPIGASEIPIVALNDSDTFPEVDFTPKEDSTDIGIWYYPFIERISGNDPVVYPTVIRIYTKNKQLYLQRYVLHYPLW